MREVDIVYLYEHTARELDVACAVAALLEKNHGLSVEIMQWPVGFGRKVHLIRPKKMVILPYCYVEEDYSPLLAYWRNIHFVNLTWEQLLYPGNEKAKMPRGDFVLKDVVHHAWSEQYAANLRKYGVSDDHIFLNGQPAYSLYDEPYRFYFKSRRELAEQYSLDPSKKWIFFPENYNWAFYLKNRLDMFIRDGQTPAQIKVMKDFCDFSLSQVLKWFEEVTNSYTDIEIIVRPRPSITVSDFVSFMRKRLGKDSPGLSVIQDETVREWILASDVVVSSHSTSLIEAAVAGKRAYMLEPYSIPFDLRAEWHQYLPHIKDFDGFWKVCAFDEKQEHVDNRLAEWARKNLINNGDAIRNLSTFIASLVTVPVPALVSAVLSNTRHYPHVWLWVIYRNLRRLYFYWRTYAIEPAFVKEMRTREEIEKRKSRWKSFILD